MSKASGARSDRPNAAKDGPQPSDALVCYCFQYRRSDIEADLLAPGPASIPERIRAAVKAGDCACEVHNPTGRCCLGDVQKAVEEISAELGVAERSSTPPR